MRAQRLQLNPKPQEPSQNVVGATGIAYINGYNVNLRSGPSTKYGVIHQLSKDESYQVWGRQGDWLNLGLKVNKSCIFLNTFVQLWVNLNILFLHEII